VSAVHPPRRPPAAPATRLRIGEIPIDVVTFAGALDGIEAMVLAGNGGAVFTPNVDHVVKAERDPAFRAAYAAADLSLVDGTPLVWASRLLGRPLPGKISGSDLVVPLARRAATRGWRIYLLGGAPGDAERAAEVLTRVHGSAVAGVDAPQLDLGPGGAERCRAAAGRARRSGAELVLVALGAPKQELFIHRHRGDLAPAVAVGVGASLAFLAGTARRAPAWVSRAGLEWLHRLASDPARLWRRYLVEDVAFLPVLARTWRRERLAREGG